MPDTPRCCPGRQQTLDRGDMEVRSTTCPYPSTAEQGRLRARLLGDFPQPRTRPKLHQTTIVPHEPPQRPPANNPKPPHQDTTKSPPATRNPPPHTSKTRQPPRPPNLHSDALTFTPGPHGPRPSPNDNEQSAAYNPEPARITFRSTPSPRNYPSPSSIHRKRAPILITLDSKARGDRGVLQRVPRAPPPGCKNPPPRPAARVAV